MPMAQAYVTVIPLLQLHQKKNAKRNKMVDHDFKCHILSN